MIAAAASSAVVGLATVVGLAGHFGVPRDNDDDDDEGQEALIDALRASKVSLQQGLTTSEQEGQPSAGKFEFNKGRLQLSVYTAKDGKFSEVLVDPATGKVAKVEPIIRADDLAAAQSQRMAMASAKTALKDAVDKALDEASGARAIGVIPNMKEGHPVASVLLLKGERFTIVHQPLD
jgi:hypothetical protein